MLRMLLCSASAFVVFAAIVPSGASAADPAAKKRCADLIAFYDHWATTKTPDHSDGARNHHRIGAELDCERGHYAAGIATMEAQIRNRVGMDVPVDVGQAPLFFPKDNIAEVPAR